jgi:hypothetical protein
MWLAKLLLLLIYGNRIRDTVLYMWVWFGEKAKKALSVQTNHMVSTIPLLITLPRSPPLPYSLLIATDFFIYFFV